MYWLISWSGCNVMLFLHELSLEASIIFYTFSSVFGKYVPISEKLLIPVQCAEIMVFKIGCGQSGSSDMGRIHILSTRGSTYTVGSYKRSQE